MAGLAIETMALEPVDSSGELAQRIRNLSIACDVVIRVTTPGDSGDGLMVLFLVDNQPFEIHFYDDGYDLRPGWTE